MSETISKRADLTESERLLIPSANPNYLFPKEISSDIGYDIKESRKVLLTGHKGCGKTSLFEQIASKMGQPVLRVNMNGQTTVSDFVGFWTVKGGETVWVDGALPLAMRRGYWLIIDEIDFAEPQILSVLNSVTEKEGKLFLKEKGHEVIEPHKYFRLFATANTVGCMEEYRYLYQGANLMNSALLDRFRVYQVKYLPREEEMKVLLQNVEGLKEEVAGWFVTLANEIRDSFEREEISCTFSLRQLIDFAELMMRKKSQYKDNGVTDSKTAEKCVIDAINIGLKSKVSKQDGLVIEGIAKRIFL